MASSVDLGALYAATRLRISGLVLACSPEELATTCAATPAWTVHDVICHLRGVCHDVRNGNMEGVTTDPWTAAQVERHNGTPIIELVNDWSIDAMLLESVLSSPTGDTAIRALYDIATHEADLRGTLGRPPELRDDLAAVILASMAMGLVTAADSAGLPGLRIDTTDGKSYGPADAPTVLTVDPFEFFRARLGRRSASQVLAYDWSGIDPADYLPHLFSFGPRDADLVD